MTERPDAIDSPSRRRFLKGTTAAVGAGAAAASWAPLVHAAGSDVIKIGLVGSGGRGTGAAEQALTADSAHPAGRHGRRLRGPARRQPLGAQGLRSVGYAGRRRQGPAVHRLRRLQEGHRPGRPRPPDHPARTSGRSTWPTRSRRAINAFVEKPMAVDGPGLRMFLQACKDAKEKNLSLVNGFCWRYFPPRRETMQHVFDGKIGDIVAIETTYNSQGVWDPRKTREQCSSDMEYQMRNWYYYSWLSRRPHRRAGRSTASTRSAGPWATSSRFSAGAWAAGKSRTDAEVRQHLRPLLDRLRVPRQRPRLPPLPPLGQHPEPGEGLHPRRQGHGRRLRQQDHRPRELALPPWPRQQPEGHARHVPDRARRDVRRAPRRASRSTTARRPPTAPCWRSWAGPPPTPARTSRPTRSSTPSST